MLHHDAMSHSEFESIPETILSNITGGAGQNAMDPSVVWDVLGTQKGNTGVDSWTNPATGDQHRWMIGEGKGPPTSNNTLGVMCVKPAGSGTPTCTTFKNPPR